MQNSAIIFLYATFISDWACLSFVLNSWALQRSHVFGSNRHATGQAYVSGQSVLQTKTCNHRQHQYDRINFNSYYTRCSWWAAQLSQHNDWLRAWDRGSTPDRDNDFSLRCYVQIGQISPSVLSEGYRGLFHKYLLRPTECGVSECNHEASIKRRPYPTNGCYVIGKKIIHSM
jgi:hypothetical protein